VIDPDCNIVRCASCGYEFYNPRPILDELIKFYSRPSQYDAWLDELEVRDQMWKRRLKLVLPFRKNGSLLDVGAGIGQFLSLARNHFEEVHGTEVSTTAIEVAKQKYGLELFRGTLDGIAHRGKTFDNISLFHVLEHVPDPKSVLRICHSLLSDQGVLIIAVPNEVACLRASLKRLLVARGILHPRRGAGRFGLPLIRLTEETSEVHLSHFTPPVLCDLLRRTGFSILKQTLDPHYVRTNRKEKLRADFYCHFCRAVRAISSTNVYDAMLVIARKAPLESELRPAA